MAATKPAANKKAKALREPSPVSGNYRIAKPKANKAKKLPKEKAVSEDVLLTPTMVKREPSSEPEVIKTKTLKKNRIKEESMSPPALPKPARKPVPSERPRKATSSKAPTSMEKMRSPTPKSDGRKKSPLKKVADGKVSKRTIKKKAKETYWPYTHIPPRLDERRKNGRQEGRNLVTWTRPRMVDKLVLHMQYELARHKIDVPWDVIAHRMHPGTSGSAVLQHFNRMRATLLAEGHLVPPALPKPGSRHPVDPKIRGYVRKYPHGSDITTMRPVPYTEPMDDLKINIPYSYDDLIAVIEAKKGKGKTKSADKEGRVAKTQSSRKTVAKEATPDPADLDSDADYDPSVKSPGKRQKASRSKAAKKYVKQEFEEEVSDAEVSEEEIYQHVETEEEESDEEVAEEEEEQEEEEDADDEEEDVEMSDSDSSDEGGARLGSSCRETSSSDEDDSDDDDDSIVNHTPNGASIKTGSPVNSVSEAGIDGAVNTLYSPDRPTFPSSEPISHCLSGFVTPAMLQDQTISYETTTLYSPITQYTSSTQTTSPRPFQEEKKDNQPRIFSHPGAGNEFLPSYPPVHLDSSILQPSGLPATFAGGLLGEKEITGTETDYISEFTNLDCVSEFDNYINMPSESHSQTEFTV